MEMGSSQMSSVKGRSHRSQVDPFSNITGVLTPRRDGHTHRCPCKDEGRDDVTLLPAKERPRLPANHQKLGENRELILSHRFRRNLPKSFSL